MKGLFGLVIMSKREAEQRIRVWMQIGRAQGYTEALNARLTFIFKPPDVIEQAEQIRRQAP